MTLRQLDGSSLGVQSEALSARSDRAELDARSDADVHEAALSDPEAQPPTRRQLARMTTSP